MFPGTSKQKLKIPIFWPKMCHVGDTKSKWNRGSAQAARLGRRCKIDLREISIVSAHCSCNFSRAWEHGVQSARGTDLRWPLDISWIMWENIENFDELAQNNDFSEVSCHQIFHPSCTLLAPLDLQIHNFPKLTLNFNMVRMHSPPSLPLVAPKAEFQGPT